ncbi:D-arabinono-1,4-lactone oxidase [Paenibacillus sp. NPDC057967]|uniref:D-arabinono-1,4-lactone oxidase n=1 Tax=Paenibacillus sp. NPDC057967 TaxID=3346293 RepID=UPI0036DA3477
MTLVISLYICIRGCRTRRILQRWRRSFCYGGRPHWGKLHTLDSERLKDRYLMWDAFRSVRAELDPDRILLSPYIQKLFDA